MHIVCCFFVSNSETPRKFKEGKDKNKHDVILYCGPSNKSVDVVAGKLFASFIFLSNEKKKNSVCCKNNPWCAHFFGHRVPVKGWEKPEDPQGLQPTCGDA